jgi:hypothetical protein
MSLIHKPGMTEANLAAQGGIWGSGLWSQSPGYGT